MPTTRIFNALSGRVIAAVMARANRDAEHEAIGILDPAPDHTVVAIGIGPGVGVHALAQRVRTVVGIDPSPAMIAATQRRCRCAIHAGIVELGLTDAAAIPLATASADGAVAVNSIQLWTPVERSIAEVARVLRPGAMLVTLTHDWAIRRSCGVDVDTWVDQTTTLCARHGLTHVDTRRARAEHGRSVVFTACRTGEARPTRP